MTTPTIVLWVITVGLVIFAWRRQDGSLKRGVELGWQTLKRNATIMLLAFTLVGFVNVLSPTSLIQDWIGPDSGVIGLFLAELIGMLLPGGPYVVFPLIAVLYSAGAGLGPAVAIITSWSTQALLTLSFEIPFLGWRFSVIRWGLGLIVPLIAGTVAMILFE
ncbi:MAG: permease [Candidatus Hermodarchaeia archaeon]|jgi:uncharacterized membrane protein YraQ (UPF0718 family)